jgi:CheY-like chemotaxis protein
MNARPIRILLVDDDEIDREAVERGFGAAAIACVMSVACNGIEALRVLRGRNGMLPLDPPFVILLDLNMPQMGGLAFLDELRADAQLADCVVFGLTTSTREADKAAAFHRHVAAYIPKSSVGDDCADLVRLIDAYWQVAELPT